MAPAQLNLLSMTQPHKLPQHDSAVESDADDSWEVKAFMQDRMAAATWPPRSYACSFCRREFRSAQALGGHMNVHRRDRARLRQQCHTNPEVGGGGDQDDVGGVKLVEEIDLELRLGW